MTDGKKRNHWPIIFIISVVTIIFVISLFAFQVRFTEYAVVLRFGKPLTPKSIEPGLHYKWPFETVWKVDNRIRCFEGNSGVLEEVFTSDGKNIIASVYVGWKVSENQVVQFLERVQNVEKAEDELTSLIRSYKNGVFSKYNFSDLISTNPENVKIAQIEKEMLESIRNDALNLIGIDIKFLGINHIGLPESVTSKVFDRMRSERQKEVQKVLSEGDAISASIKAKATKESTIIIADAENAAKKIRAEGDAEAAKNYAIFKREP